MVQLGILLTQNHRLLSIAAILDVFETLNRFYVCDGAEPFFEISLIGTGKNSQVNYGQYRQDDLGSDRQYRLILIPAFLTDDIKIAVRDNVSCLKWLNDQYSNGAEVGSVCTGAFLLAASGLLNNKLATTHINAVDSLSLNFPMVKLCADAVLTEDCGIYTSGGATSSFHLLLRIIENYCGRDRAIQIAKYFAIDMDREQQTYFGTFQPVQLHNDELVNRLQKRIRDDFAKVNTVEELIADIPASRRNLVRRFKGVTGLTPIEYLQKTRIEAAKKLLEQASGGVLEAMIVSGYSDQKAFRQLFKKNVGMTPSAYRDKYNRRPAEIMN